MLDLYINMMFLYFPEDKTEYIPGTIICLIFMGFAVFTVYAVIKKSKKDEEKFNQQYAEQITKAKENGKHHQQHS